VKKKYIKTKKNIKTQKVTKKIVKSSKKFERV